MLAADRMLPFSHQPTKAPLDENVFYTGVDGMANLFCQGQDGKYCMLYKLSSVSHSSSTLPFEYKHRGEVPGRLSTRHSCHY